MPVKALLPDIILLIIDQIAPSPSIIALPASHTTTRTLSSLALTSRLTTQRAVRLLLTHCLCIDAPWRLKSLLAYIAKKSMSNPLYIQGLYLAPFPEWSINNAALCNDVHRLLAFLSPSLKRLVVDIPFRSLYPEDDDAKVRPILREAFDGLRGLEIFCSAQDELYLSQTSPPEYFDETWPAWSKLRILALYNSYVADTNSWEHLAKLEHLEALILTRSDGQDMIDMKAEWRRYNKEKRRLLILIVNTEAEFRPLHGLQSWVEDEIVVREVSVPTSYYGDDNITELCQQWVKRKMLLGDPLETWV